jgi:hypothetical protein
MKDGKCTSDFVAICHNGRGKTLFIKKSPGDLRKQCSVFLPPREAFRQIFSTEVLKKGEQNIFGRVEAPKVSASFWFPK